MGAQAVMAGFYAHVEKKHREVGPLGLELEALERLERVLQQAALCLHLRADWGGAALHLRSALLKARMSRPTKPCQHHRCQRIAFTWQAHAVGAGKDAVGAGMPAR